MQTPRTKISASQFIFSVACFIQSSMLLSSFLFPISKQNSWIIVIIGTILSIALVWIYAKLMSAFPNLTLIGLMRHVFGPFIGTIFSALYMMFFATLTALNLRYFAEFIQQTIMPHTPISIVMATCMLVCAWAVKEGPIVLTRYGSMFTFLTTFIIVLSIVLSTNLYRDANFLILYDQKPMEYIQSTHICLTVLFSEVIAYMMITPYTGPYKRKMGFYWIIGLAIGALSIFASILRDIAVLDGATEIFMLPFFETLRLIRFGATPGRMEVFFLIVIITLFFNKIMLLYYSSMVSMAQLIKQRSYKPFVLVVGALILVYAYIIYPSVLQITINTMTIIPIIWTPFTIIVPILALITAKLRGLLPKNREEVQRHA